LLQGRPFQPEEVAVMGSVFEEILETLGLINREDPAAILVAEKIIELAQTGVHDPIRLKQLTLDAFRLPN
jgi:hypothetical protein